MSLISRPLNDLPVEATLFLRGEYLSLFRHYYTQVIVGRSCEEVCDRRWPLNEGRDTALDANILEMAGETMEDVETEYR